MRQVDISESVERLFHEHILPTVGTALPDPNTFRREHAYTRDVSLVFEGHAHSLRVLFAALASLDRPGHLLSLRGWRRLVTPLHVGERCTALCFAWSIMAVHDGQTALGQEKETHLPFEGFLEALCRLVTLVALPTPDEAVHLAKGDVGVAYHRMRRAQPEVYWRMVTERTKPWAVHARDEAAPQPGEEPLHCRLGHVLSILFRFVKGAEETDSHSGGPLVLEAAEVAAWVSSP